MREPCQRVRAVNTNESVSFCRKGLLGFTFLLALSWRHSTYPGPECGENSVEANARLFGLFRAGVDCRCIEVRVEEGLPLCDCE